MRTSSPTHLVRRWWRTVRAEPLSPAEQEWVRIQLLTSEWSLWSTMDWRDQRHSFQVARRFEEAMSGSIPLARSAIAAALLHDVGKAASRLSTYERVLVTLIGGRTERWRAYLDHEAAGVDLCRRAGSDPQTLALLAGEGDERLQQGLQRADEI